VLDYLAVAVHELASMSERRIERLVNPGKSLICDKYHNLLSTLTYLSNQ